MAETTNEGAKGAQEEESASINGDWRVRLSFQTHVVAFRAASCTI